MMDKKKILYILRGVPGSGKSTYAKQIMENRVDAIGEHYEADMYFTDGDNYYWSADKLFYAHKWCYFSVCKAMDKPSNDYVIVSNTFVTTKDIKPYVKAAQERGWDVSVLRFSNRFQNVHSVPPEVVQSMLDKFQDYEGEIKIPVANI